MSAEFFTDLIKKAEDYVKAELSGNDGSHDWFHIDRVRNVAVGLAVEEKLTEEERIVVELGALLHDIKDWKYSGDEHAGADAAKEFLEFHKCPQHITNEVLFVIANIGFKTELGQLAAQNGSTPSADSAPAAAADHSVGSKRPNEEATDANNSKKVKTGIVVTPALAVVQDADRLDAIGAIGIGRCFTYGGARNRAMYDPSIPPVKDITKEQYMKQKNSPSINHFYEKLLRLKGMLKTESGRKRGEQRHKFMEQFLDQFYAEWEGRS